MSDRYAVAATPIGDAYVAWSAAGVTCVRRCTGTRDFERFYLDRYGRPLKRAARPPAEVARAVAGRCSADAVRCDLRDVPPFDRAVLERTRMIPPGAVLSYGELAAEIGSPRAARAVGSALGRNPVPIIIPCHRVIRAGGRIGAYGDWGVEAKRALLAAEGVRL